MTAPKANPSILQISPYVQGKSKAEGVAKIYKLSSNETPLGASPHAIAAYKAQADCLELYPEGSALALRTAIGKIYNVPAENIMCGAGSDEVLNLIAYAYLSEGDEAIYTKHGFLVYPLAIMSAGATPVVADEVDLHTNVDAILAKVTPKTKMVFVANPNNPTGTYISAAEIARLHKNLPSSVVLVLDAAYGEYVEREDYNDGTPLAKQFENIIVTHTYSKLYGLAGLRLGWCYACSEIIDVLNRIRGPFNISSSAIACGIAAVEDQAFVRAAVAHNKKWLQWLSYEVQQLGLKITPSVCNFLLIHFDEAGDKTAAKADEYLTKHGFIVRALGNYHLPHCLRVSIGTAEAIEGFVACLKEFMEK